MNLAVNARDAMPDGGALTLETAQRRPRRGTRRTAHPGSCRGPLRACSRSATPGSGMTPEVSAHLFEPFFTTKEPARAPGSACRRSTASSSRAAATSRSRASRARHDVSHLSSLRQRRLLTDAGGGHTLASCVHTPGGSRCDIASPSCLWPQHSWWWQAPSPHIIRSPGNTMRPGR